MMKLGMRSFSGNFKNSLLFFICYTCLAFVGLRINAVHTFAALIWPPSGLAFAYLLIFGIRAWPSIFCGAFVVNFALGAPFFAAMGIATGNTLEAVFGACLCLNTRGFRTSLDNMRSVLSLFAWGAMCGTLISASIGVASLGLAGRVPAYDMPRTWLTWWVGDVIGILVLSPMLLIFANRKKMKPLVWEHRRYIEAAVLTALLLTISVTIFTFQPNQGPRAMRSYFIFPLLIWASLRFRSKGTVLSTFIFALIALWGTATLQGPFAGGTPDQNLIHLLVFISAAWITSFVVSAVVTDRDRESSKLRLSTAVVEQRTKELQQREGELKQAKEAAEAASDAKSTFLANMSHEIRTPLGAVLGFSELLATSELSQKEKTECVDAIKRNSHLLSSIINDILDLSKVEAGKLNVEMVAVPFGEIITDVKTLLNLEATGKGIQLTLASEDIIPIFIKTDPIRLRQILINVIGNAIKFTERGSVDVRVKLVPNSRAGRNLLTFVVKDTGSGISTDQAQKLFSPFSQADSSTTRRFGGTGLGLVLSKKLALALGGDVVLAESELGRGSTFIVSIDPGTPDTVLFNNFDKDNLIPRTKIEKPIGHLNLSVLLVEDSPDNQVLITRHLRGAGAKVETASNGREGYEKATEGNFDLVLMDLQMPEMDGYEATRKLRGQGYQKPIIALTAYAMKDDRIKCLANGFNDHISKPIDRHSLLKAISEYSLF